MDKLWIFDVELKEDWPSDGSTLVGFVVKGDFHTESERMVNLLKTRLGDSFIRIVDQEEIMFKDDGVAAVLWYP